MKSKTKTSRGTGGMGVRGLAGRLGRPLAVSWASMRGSEGGGNTGADAVVALAATASGIRCSVPHQFQEDLFQAGFDRTDRSQRQTSLAQLSQQPINGVVING